LNRLSSFYFTGAIALVLIFIAMSCATPIAPTGGPPDRTPPVVTETFPPSGTTNFVGNEVRFTFSKFIDRNSFRQNISIEPDLALDYEISFRRRTAIVEFQSDLPENTTLVVKVGVDVTDTDRNKMASSFDLALSTGPDLDEGRVTARVLEAETGRGESGRRVFLYREPVDFSQRARYVAQSDTSGQVEFGFLSPGTYRAFWVNDVNRNRIWDRNREAAQPFYIESVELEANGEADLGTLYVSMPDTVAPVIEGVGLLSERRLRVRSNEEIRWDPGARIQVADSLGNEVTTAWPLFTPQDNPRVFFAQADEALQEGEYYTLYPEGVSDKAGNALEAYTDPFEGSSEPDTTGLRTVSHNAGSGLFPDEPLEITYTKFIDDNAVLDSLLVFEGDRMFEEWPAAEVDRHILRISPSNETWESGVQYEFRVWDPWESDYLRINPDIWQRNQLGSIEVTLTNGLDDVDNRLVINDMDNSIEVDTTFTGSTIEIENLPPLEYRVRVWQDVNRNRRWDSGSVDPYRRPEPYAIRRSVPVREGFTSEVEITFAND
jgi:uncharacterized protein (DUF2141 family)